MGNNYQVRVQAVLDAGKLRAQLQALGKNTKVNFDTSSIKGAQQDVKKFGDTVSQTTSAGGKGARNMGREFKGLKTYITDGAKSLGSIAKQRVAFLAMTDIVSGAAQGMKAMVGSVFELDASLTEMKKVSDLNGASLDAFTKKAFDVGAEVARTGTEVVDAATQFKKMGYTVNESLDLAKVATMFQNIADTEISAGDAAAFINSQLKAFHGELSKFGNEGKQATRVIDAVNEVANNFGVGTNDLQLALSKTSSAMAGYGNSFSETLGIITAGTEVMVGQPSKVARGWRTIGANILKMAKAQDTYTDSTGKVNVALKDSQGQIRSTYGFLKDLDGQWGNLSETEKNAIALDLAGKNQMEVFKATMDNFSSAIGANETALNSQGSAAKENAKYLESLQGHLANLKSAFSEFANAIISSGLLKNIIDIGTAILKVAASDFGQFILKAGLVATAVGLIARAFNKLHGVVKGMSFLEGLKTLWLGTAKATDKDTAATQRNTAATDKNTAAHERNAAARAKASAASAGENLTPVTSPKLKGGKQKVTKGASEGALLLGSGKNLKNSEKQLSKMGKSATKVGSKFKGAAKSAGLFMASLSTPQMLGIAAAIGAVSWAVVSTTKATNKHTKSVEKMVESNKKQEKSIENNAKTADFYIGKIDELAKKEHRNASEKKLLASYVKQLNELYPELNLTYDENTDKLSQNTNELKDNIDKLKEKQKLDLAESAAQKALKKSQSKQSKAEDIKSGIQQTMSSVSKMSETDPKRQTYINKLKKAQVEYKDALRASSNAMVEYTRNQNKVAMASEDYQKLAEKIPDSIKSGIKKGIYTAPLNEQDLNKLVDFDKAASAFEASGKKIPNSIYAGIQDGIYTMPTTKLELSNLVSFDKAKTQMESLGFDLPESFITSFQKMSPKMQTAYAQVFDKLGDVSPEVFAKHFDEINSILSEEGTSMQTKMQKIADALGIDIKMGDVDISTVEDVEKKIDKLDGKSAKITLQAYDEASGKIEDVTIEADDYAAGSYVAELLGVDNASAMVEYAADVANGFEGDYTAWLMANNSDALSKGKLTKEQLEAIKKGDYKAVLKADNSDANKKANDAKSKAAQYARGQYQSKITANAGSAISTINSVNKKKIQNKSFSITATLKGLSGKIKEALGFAKGKRQGEQGGLAWVGDEGTRANPKPELIQTQKGAFLAGTTGWEMLPIGKDDIVYSNAETKRLLGDRGISITSSMIPRYASGTPKFLSSDSDSDSIKKKIEAWSNQVDQWEHNLDIGRVSESQYVNWLKSQYKISNKMTEDQYRSAEKTIWNYYNEYEKAALDNYLTSVKYGKMSLDKALDYIAQSRKAQKITQEQADELNYEAYKNHIEWNISKFKSDEATYSDTKKLVLDFYNYQKKYGKMSLDDYYDYLDDLADAAQEKEQDRLEKLQTREENQRDLAKLYVQQQVDAIEKQIDAIDKQNEAQEKANELAELYNNLSEARSKRVKVYREGVGFVYEQDTAAIKEATKALQDYKSEEGSNALESLKQQWQDILDMFDDQETLADIKELENALGITSGELFGGKGTDLSVWTEWYKNSLSTGMGLADIISKLEGLEGWDKISGYLNSDGQVDINKIKQAIQNNRFASGTTNAKGGLSVVGENGWEIGMLNKGDAIFPHEISKNLMKWGMYNPDKYQYRSQQGDITQSFNFDKLVLPNVSNGREFIDELKKLPNLAIQKSGSRR